MTTTWRKSFGITPGERPLAPLSAECPRGRSGHLSSSNAGNGLGIKGVTLHSYRYAWAERAKKAGYPEQFAMENSKQNSKAVHRAYSRKAKVELPSLGEYERRRKAFANGSGVEPVAQAALA